MEFGKAFSFAFEDPDWLKKLGIGALLMIIPIIGWLVVAGWGIEITKRVIQHDPQPLPDWSDFGGYLIKGLQVFVIGFVYSLPVTLVNICQQGVTVFGQQGNNSDQTIATVLMVVGICFGCVSFLYSIFLGFIMPAALGNFAATGQMSAGFRFAEVFGMVRATPMAYLMALLGGIVAGIIAVVGVIACVIGVLFTSVYAYTINAHLYGQAYNEAKAVSGLKTAY
jgi:Protein of unknown function (DUF4013)